MFIRAKLPKPFGERVFDVQLSGAELAYIGALSYGLESGSPVSPFGGAGSSVDKAVVGALGEADRAAYMAEVRRLADAREAAEMAQRCGAFGCGCGADVDGAEL